MPRYAFEPDYAVAPGATLKESLAERGMSQSELARRTGLAQKTISHIINGTASITPATSEKLELVTGVPASFWNRREADYRETLAKREGLERLKADVDWLKEIPVAELVKRGIIDHDSSKPEMVRRVLKFFGVSSVDSWKNIHLEPAVQFRGRKSQAKRPGYVAAWLRIGELAGHSIDCTPFDAKEFQRRLDDIRSFTLLPVAEFAERLREACASAGVAVVFVKEIPKASVSGATRWLTKDKAIIQMSLKYKTDDHFWFTFFHEAGHILLHGKNRSFVEFGTAEDTLEEHEANTFSANCLIPEASATSLQFLKSKVAMREFAASIDIAPGIVVGRLQHDGLPHSHCNDLKRKLAWQ